MEWIASTVHTTSEHGVSSITTITTADGHTSAASSRLNWRPRRFKWTLSFRSETKSGFCAYTITFQTQSTKRDEVTGEWGKLHNEELNDLYCSPDIVRARKSRRKRWPGHVARMASGERRGLYRVLVGKHEGKRPLGRPRRKWEFNLKMYVQEVGCSCLDCICLLMIGTGGGNLWMPQWTFRFHKMRGISWLAENQLASQDGLCYMEYCK